MRSREIKDIKVVGVATIRFGEHWHRSLESLAREVAVQALANMDIPIEKIDTLFVANMLSGMLGNQENLGPFIADCLGISVPAVKVEKMTDLPLLNVTGTLCPFGQKPHGRVWNY